MTGRLSLLVYVMASGGVHFLPAMPGHSVLITTVLAISAGSVLVFFLLPRHKWRILLPVWAMVLGFSLTALRIEHRLADSLDADNVNKVSRVVLRIASLPRLEPNSRYFEAEVLSSQPLGVPSRIMVSWSGSNYKGPYGRSDDEPAEFPELIPGQVWRMALTLRPTHGLRNPNAFDYEAHAFSQGIRGSGTVRGTPVFLYDQPWSSLAVVAERARYYVRHAMQAYLQDKRYGVVMLALAIGDQASVSADDWLIFNRTGITHLVSISGSHITLIAALGGSLTYWLWRRVRYRERALAEYIPAQVASALFALLIAWLYSLLAGWGVPARRTFFMLAVMALAYASRAPFNASRLLSLVAFVVVVLDPWSMLSSGFWLSFGAVSVLMASAGWEGQKVGGVQASGWRKIMPVLTLATRLQLSITVALLPILALLFHEVSLVSPLANAYAIPIISVLVTPLSLLLAFFALIPGCESIARALAWLGHEVLYWMMQPTHWLGQLDLASVTVAAAPLALTLVAVMGLIWALLPYGFPGRYFGWLLMAPALLWSHQRPGLGDWDLYALDLGQASATVIRTKEYTLLFDAGLRSSANSDSGTRVIWPFLRSVGIKALDTLVLSHADIDHVGGTRTMLDAMPVQLAYSSFDLPAYLKREARILGVPGQLPDLPVTALRCQYGQHWRVDNVDFEFLWPLPDLSGTKDKNEQGCVLRVRGEHHSVLLTGDIGIKTEAQLIKRGLWPVDVVMAGHHGSKTSSSDALVLTTQAQHVVAQAGAWSRFGHPHPTVVKRWQDAGAQFWRTDLDGAVQVSSSQQGLVVTTERYKNKRYWQGG